MTAYDKLRELLYSDSFALEVLPRRRLFLNGTIASVSGAQVDVNSVIPLSPPITFSGPGDGLLFEAAQLNFAPVSSSTVICTDAALTVNSPGTGLRGPVFGLKRSRQTFGGAATFAALAVGEQFDLSPGLFGSLDLAGAASKNAPVASISTITFSATFADGGIASQNIAWQVFLFLRQVRGLQEN